MIVPPYGREGKIGPTRYYWGHRHFEQTCAFLDVPIPFMKRQKANQMKMDAIAKMTLPLLFFTAAIANDDIEGVYERVSLMITRTGESPEAAN